MLGSVGMKIFLFFWKAIKIAGSAQKNRVGRVSGNTGIFIGLTHFRASSSVYHPCNDGLYIKLSSVPGPGVNFLASPSVVQLVVFLSFGWQC